MTTITEKQLLRRIRTYLTIFIILLVLSGITAFPIETELNWLKGYAELLPAWSRQWLLHIHEAVSVTNARYPMLSYGTDWLAFAHMVIAVAFIGPLRDPVRNIWIIHFGMIACLMVLPLALIAGHIRQIPLFWQCIDCSFGLLGLLPLEICRRYTSELAFRKQQWY